MTGPVFGRRYLSVPEIADLLGETQATVRKWLHRGRIRRAHGGRVDAAALLTYLDGRGDHGRHTSDEA